MRFVGSLKLCGLAIVSHSQSYRNPSLATIKLSPFYRFVGVQEKSNEYLRKLRGKRAASTQFLLLLLLHQNDDHEENKYNTV